MKTYHYVYKIVCLLNGKEYVGVHSSDEEFDEAYWSSSYYLNEDIKALGKQNFTREVLSYHSSRVEALDEEARLVNRQWTARHDTYNVVCGGHGPNWTGTVIAKDKEGNSFCVVETDERLKTGDLVGIMKGVPMGEEHKAKLSAAFKGKIWVNKDGKNKRIWDAELEQHISLGWARGRTYHDRKEHSQETRNKIGRGNTGKICSEDRKALYKKIGKNKIWITKNGQTKFIDKSEIDFYISENWIVSKRHFQPRKKNRLGKAVT